MNVVSSIIIGVVSQAEADLQGFSTPWSYTMGLSAMVVTYLCLRKLPKLPHHIAHGAILLTAMNQVRKSVSLPAVDQFSEMNTQVAQYQPTHSHVTTTDGLFHQFQNGLPTQFDDIKTGMRKSHEDTVGLESSKSVDALYAKMLSAINQDNIPAVSLLLESGADVNQVDKRGYSLLGKAILFNQIDMARFLIEKGAVVDIDCLAIAVRKGDKDAASLLLENGADVNQVDEHGLILLEKTIRHKEIDMARFLIEKGAVADFDSLKTAVYEGNKDAVSLLLENGADVNQVDKIGFSLLELAIRRKGIDMARFLIENGAVVDFDSLATVVREDYKDGISLLLENETGVKVFNKHGGTLLEIAIRYEQIDMARFLIEKGAVADFRSLERAVRGGNKNWISLLLKSETDVNQRDPFGFSLLEIANLNEQIDMARLLIEKGAVADFDMLETAVRRGNKDWISLLIESGVDVNQRDKYGFSLLQKTISRKEIDIARLLIEKGAVVDFDSLATVVRDDYKDGVSLLLENGADVNQRGKYGFSLLRIAIRSKQIDIARFLIENGAAVDLDRQDLQKLNRLISEARDPEMAQWFVDHCFLDKVSIVETAIKDNHHKFAVALAQIDGELLLEQAFQQRAGCVVRFLNENNLADVESLLNKFNDAKKIELLGYLFSLGILITGGMINHVLKNRELEKGMKQGIENLMQALKRVNTSTLDFIKEELNKIDAILSHEGYREKFKESNPHAMSQLLIARGVVSLCDTDFLNAYENLEEAKGYAKTEKMNSLILMVQEFLQDQEDEIINQDLQCPISHEIMKEPVKYTKNGHAYYFEKNQIVRRIEDSARCPFTSQPLSVDDLQEAPDKEKALADYKKSLMGAVRDLMSEAHPHMT